MTDIESEPYRDFLLTKRQPVAYLPQILKLKQSLASNNLDESKKIVEELEKIAQTERIHILEQYLLFILSRMMYVQNEAEMMEFSFSDILHNLLKIKTYNQLDKDSYYISIDSWDKHFNALLEAALEISHEACMTNEVRGWSGEFNRDLLWQDVQQILACTYSLPLEDIEGYLRSYWSDYQFLPY